MLITGKQLNEIWLNILKFKNYEKKVNFNFIKTNFNLLIKKKKKF